MTRHSKRLVPLAILAFGLLGVAVIRWLSPEVEQEPVEVFAPRVRVETVEVRPVDFVVRAHGTVTPRTESSLIPQVDGPVVWISPALASGGFFDADEALVRIDGGDYEVALESARASVARTTSEFERARKDLERQQSLKKQSVASASRYDEAVNAERIASAALREAKAKRKRAEFDLERTEIRAPYAGRVREKSVDVGQFVSRGTPIARIYAVDFAEVRLPIPDSELGFIELPMLYDGGSEDERGPEVTLHAKFAGRDHTWKGEIVRTEGEIDPRSRMVNVVARVDDPYGRLADPVPSDRVPLAVGLFVEAEIHGRRVDQAVTLPRSALRDGRNVLVVGEDDRLRFREVELLRSERDTIVIGAGLEPGERVIVSPLATVVDGMAVRAVRDGETPNEPHGAVAEEVARPGRVATVVR